jgi:hypothetical protein
MKKIFWGLIFLSGFLTLTSCVSPELVARRNSDCSNNLSFSEKLSCIKRSDEAYYREKENAEKERKIKVYVSSLMNTCRTFGFSENTDPFRNCLLSQHQANVAALQRQQQIDAANSAANSSAYMANQEYLRQMNEAFNRLNPNHPSYYLR